MRLFVAIDPSDEAVQSLAAIVPVNAQLRYVPRVQWHVTLAFYGEVAETLLDELAERLSRAAARTPLLHLSVNGGGTFPTRVDRARVLWCGLSGDTSALSRLAERAVAAGRRCGIAIDDREFRPHITLARSRGPSTDMTSMLTALAQYVGPEWTTDRVRLIRSYPGPQTRHELLASWQLGASSATQTRPTR